ncbi:MAG: 50S ribosomal protein L21 [Candidatus Omnitrophota bacterium]|jgi:large subunit ribosomal protein L21
MSAYAIVETGSKQYWVEPKSILEVELLEGAGGQGEVVLDRVLFYADGNTVLVGTPVVKGAQVICENLGEIRAPKVIHYRMRRRKASRRKHGHRQDLLRLRVKDIKV